MQTTYYGEIVSAHASDKGLKVTTCQKFLQTIRRKKDNLLKKIGKRLD